MRHLGLSWEDLQALPDEVYDLAVDLVLDEQRQAEERLADVQRRRH